MKFNIQAKLLFAFAVILIMTGIVGYVGYSGTNTINNDLEHSLSEPDEIHIGN
jgi:hypothetical protein